MKRAFRQLFSRWFVILAVGAIGGTALFAQVTPPALSKSFSPNTIPAGGVSTLTFGINNAGPGTADETGVGFTDALPAGMIVATPNGLSGSCGGGTITATAGSGTVSLSGAILPQGTSCTFSVHVTASAPNIYINSTTITSVPGGPGSIAIGVLTVTAASVPALTPGMLAAMACALALFGWALSRRRVTS